jgi:hypothetical protein
MRRFFPWLGAAAILTVIFGTMYAAIQQAQRRDANYPQIQLAEDTATNLNAGNKPRALVSGKVNFGSSLAPFIIIYDKAGHAVAGSGILDNTIPDVPKGMLAAASGRPYHAVTWQPQAGVRIAAVTVAAQNYYVLSGRSLSEVEKNESRTLQLASLGCIVCLLILGATFVTSDPSHGKR